MSPLIVIAVVGMVINYLCKLGTIINLRSPMVCKFSVLYVLGHGLHKFGKLVVKLDEKGFFS